MRRGAKLCPQHPAATETDPSSEERYAFGDWNFRQADILPQGTPAQGHPTSHTRVPDGVRFAEHRDPVAVTRPFHEPDRRRVFPTSRPAANRHQPNGLWSHPATDKASKQPAPDPLPHRVPVFLADARIVPRIPPS